MSIVRFLTAAAATVAVAAPAAAQYYPQPAYPQYQQSYPGYAYPQQAYPQQAYPQAYGVYGQQAYGAQNPVQAIIDQLLGNRYQTSDRTKVAQCAAAAQAQAAAQYRPNAYGQPYGNAYGYNNRAYGAARVTGITNVERRSNGLRVSGVMSSGMQRSPYGAYSQGYNQGYNRAYAAGVNDLSFRCNVDYRGAVTNVRVRPTTTWRG
jgi:hypothetical protein